MTQFKPKPAYPLMNQAEDIRAASGRPLAEITLEVAEDGKLSPSDLRITPETLQAQAEVARQAGYVQLAANLTRAAELTAVPNEALLRMYDILRPGRATFQELMALAGQLENEYKAPANAQLVREAASVYQTRGLLKRV